MLRVTQHGQATKSCSICKQSIRRLKQLENEYFCYVCLEKYACPKCNQIYDGCVHCHKKLCDCVKYCTEYDYGGDLTYCIDCFEKQDPETQLYFYFRDKYNEPLTLVEIQTIIKTKQKNND